MLDDFFPVFIKQEDKLQGDPKFAVGLFLLGGRITGNDLGEGIHIDVGRKQNDMDLHDLVQP